MHWCCRVWVTAAFAWNSYAMYSRRAKDTGVLSPKFLLRLSRLKKKKNSVVVVFCPKLSAFVFSCCQWGQQNLFFVVSTCVLFNACTIIRVHYLIRIHFANALFNACTLCKCRTKCAYVMHVYQLI